MKVVAVVSAKGGVGKTTLTANLADALQQSGRSVLVVDLDPQNSLQHYFAQPLREGQGLAHVEDTAAGLRDSLLATSRGVSLIPYGVCDEPGRLAFERRLAGRNDWLTHAFGGLGLDEEQIVLLDTPPGPSPYLAQALSAADLAVAVVLPDAGSYVTVPQLQRLIQTYGAANPRFQGYGFVLNQLDQERRLNQDVARMLRDAFEPHMMGGVHRDESLSEALAFGQTISQYAPHSEAAHDIAACARWLSDRLQYSRAEVS